MSNAQPLWRTIAYRALVVLFVLGMIGSTTAIWANVRVQESDAWASTVGPLADDLAVQEFVVAQAATVIERQIAADEGAGRLQSFSRTQINALVSMALGDFVTSPTFATWWTEANRAAHGIVMRTMDSEQGVLLQTHGGDLVLDLRPAVSWVNAQLETLLPRSSYLISLPAEQAVIVLYSSDALETVANIVDLVDTLAFVLPVITVLALVGAIALKRSLATALTQIALSLAAGMVLVLVLINISRWVLVSQQPESHQDVLNAIIRISLADLMLAFRAIAIIALLRAGLVMLLGSKYVNNPRVKAFFRGNREAIVAFTMGLALVWLVLSNYPPIWLTILALIVVAGCGVQLYRWRRESPIPEVTT